jgi:uncharacterized protein with PIN domain
MRCYVNTGYSGLSMPVPARGFGTYFCGRFECVIKNPVTTPRRKTGVVGTDPAPRFIADAMLGSLTKWMRLLGYDVAYEKKIDDGELIERALAENRVILTRDVHFLRRRLSGRVGLFRFENDRLPDQLRRVVREFHLSTDRHRLTRCVECNLRLHPVPREAAAGRVPDYVFETQDRFTECPGCRRLFWAGTHPGRIEDTLRRIFRGMEEPGHD